MTKTATPRYIHFSLIGTMAALLVSPAVGQNPVPPPPGIVGWWAMDNSANDVGPLGLNGSIAGAGGAFETAHVLEGFRPASGNGHVQVADSDVLDVGSNFTIELWVRLDALTTGHSYFVNKGSDDHRTTPFTFGVIRNDNLFPVTSGASRTGVPWGGRPFVTFSDGNLEQVLFGGAEVPRNVYSHVAVTMQPASGFHQARIYINGVERGFAWFGRIPFVGVAPLQIGGINGGTDNSLNGVLDEVTMYDRALTVTEIRAIHLAGPDGKEKTIVDTTPPQLTIDQPMSGQVLGDPMVAVQATVIDDGSTTVDSIPAGLAAQLPDGGGVASGSVNLSGPDGTQWITVQAVDSAGNAAATSVDIVLDTAAPFVSVISPQSGMVFGSSPAQVAVQVADMTATELNVGGALRFLPAGGATVTVDVPLVVGSNSISISAMDAAGNRTEIFWNLVLDVNAPVVSILNPPDGALLGAGQNPVAISTRVDDLSATSVVSSPPGAGGSLPAGGGILSGAGTLQEGLNQIVVTATDSGGNSSSAAITVNLDTTAPMVSFGSPGSGDLVSGIVEIIVDAQDAAPGSGVAQMELYAGQMLLTSGPGANLTVDLDTLGLGDGNHVLMAMATDGAGNQGSASMSITVDNTPPTIQILSPGNGAVVSGTGQFSALVTDSGSGVMTVVQLVGGLAPTNDGSVQLTSPVPSIQVDGSEDTTRWPNGALNCEVQATDMAGNYATALVAVEVQNEIVIPDTDVVVELKPWDGKRVHGTIKIKLNADGAYELEIQVDGETIAMVYDDKLRVDYDTTQRMDGPMEITGIVHTASGTSTTVHNVTVDNIKVKGLFPSQLTLSSSPHKGYVWVKVSSRENSALPMHSDTMIELRLRGGSSIKALRTFADKKGRIAWVVFDRRDLVAAIRGALVAGGELDGRRKRMFKQRLSVYMDGHKVGTAKVKLRLKR